MNARAAAGARPVPAAARLGPPALALGLLVALGVALGGGIAAPAPAPAPSSLRPAASPPANPLVWVSGRDDHGLLREHEVALRAEPRFDAPRVSVAHDGRVARVLETRGEWLRVRTVGPPEVEGWVNDFYLRDRALRVDGNTQVRLVEAAVEGGRVRLAVRPLTEPSGAVEWVDLDRLREVGARSSPADDHHR